MTGRIFTGQNRSGHKGGQNETFKAVERRPATFDLGTRDCAFERVDQRGGNPQILSSRQFTLGLGECAHDHQIGYRKSSPEKARLSFPIIFSSSLDS
ncbi:hypothetical protein ACXHXG_24700 [Rhizobium sp. LEGMi198b]